MTQLTENQLVFKAFGRRDYDELEVLVSQLQCNPNDLIIDEFCFQYYGFNGIPFFVCGNNLFTSIAWNLANIKMETKFTDWSKVYAQIRRILEIPHRKGANLEALRVEPNPRDWTKVLSQMQY